MKEYLITGNVTESMYNKKGIIVGDRVFYQHGWDVLDEAKHSIVKIYEAPIVNHSSWSFGSVTDEGLVCVWEKIAITENEKIMLRILDKKYRYIVRDKDGELFIFEEKPIKNDECLVWVLSKDDCTASKFPFSEYFKGVTWEDEEPTLIEDLLR